MQRHLLRALAASIYPLLGLAALLAAAGCAAPPNLAAGQMRPAPTASPSPDIFSGLAQRMNIMPASAPDVPTATAAK